MTEYTFTLSIEWNSGAPFYSSEEILNRRIAQFTIMRTAAAAATTSSSNKLVNKLWSNTPNRKKKEIKYILSEFF